MSTCRSRRSTLVLLLLALFSLLLPSTALAGGAPPKLPTEISYVGVSRHDVAGYASATTFLVVVRATGVNSTYRVRATVTVDGTIVGNEVHKMTSGSGMTEWSPQPFIYTTPATWTNATVDVGLYPRGADTTKPSAVSQQTRTVTSTQLPLGWAVNLYCAPWYVVAC
jgi:hypothetical protein